MICGESIHHPWTLLFVQSVFELVTNKVVIESLFGRVIIHDIDSSDKDNNVGDTSGVQWCRTAETDGKMASGGTFTFVANI